MVVHDLDAWLLSYWRLSGLSLQAGSVSNLCRCLPAWDHGGRASSDLGLAGVERVLVVAALPFCKFKLLLGSVSAGSECLWWTVGQMEGLGEIVVLLQDDSDACGRRHLLEGVV
jgi:hypothetical protein